MSPPLLAGPSPCPSLLSFVASKRQLQWRLSLILHDRKRSVFMWQTLRGHLVSGCVSSPPAAPPFLLSPIPPPAVSVSLLCSSWRPSVCSEANLAQIQPLLVGGGVRLKRSCRGDVCVCCHRYNWSSRQGGLGDGRETFLKLRKKTLAYFHEGDPKRKTGR